MLCAASLVSGRHSALHLLVSGRILCLAHIAIALPIAICLWLYWLASGGVSVNAFAVAKFLVMSAYGHAQDFKWKQWDLKPCTADEEEEMSQACRTLEYTLKWALSNAYWLVLRAISPASMLAIAWFILPRHIMEDPDSMLAEPGCPSQGLSYGPVYSMEGESYRATAAFLCAVWPVATIAMNTLGIAFNLLQLAPMRSCSA